MKRAYLILLGFYPAEYRALFEREMLALFEEAAGERRGDAAHVMVLHS
jgi:hypothetical protein